MGLFVKRILRHIRDTFISGLLAIIPVGVTLYILWFFYQWIDGLVGKNTPFGLMVQKALGRWIPGLGIYITLIVVLLVGIATRSFLGRVLQHYMERVFFSPRRETGAPSVFPGRKCSRQGFRGKRLSMLRWNWRERR